MMLYLERPFNSPLRPLQTAWKSKEKGIWPPKAIQSPQKSSDPDSRSFPKTMFEKAENQREHDRRSNVI